MLTRFLLISLALSLASEAFGQNPIVNVDLGTGTTPYAALGALSDDSANTTWNNIGASGSGLLASDGTTLVGTSLEDLTIQLQGLGNTDGNVAQTNNLLKDYQYVSVYFGPQEGTISITGLKPNTDYELYVYASGDNIGQGSVIILNGEIGLTNGTPPGTTDFLLGDNYVVMEIRANGAGEIKGNWYPLKSADGPAGTGAINGMQIRESTLPTRIIGVTGANSPTVYSPGDEFEFVLTFSEQVKFGQNGVSSVNLDFGGGAAGMVTALHVAPVIAPGGVDESKHRFVATAPGVNSAGALVVSNSLQLNGATLTDEATQGVPLGHGEFGLPNNQVSMQTLSVYSTDVLDPDTSLNLAQSPYYRIRVRDLSLPTANWLPSFAWITQAPMDDINTVGTNGSYEDYVGNWSHTYTNFEMTSVAEIEIEITRLDPTTLTPIAITKAVPSPRRKVKSWRIEDGKAFVVIDRPMQLAVDIDGQFDQPSQLGQVNENALHAVSIFANPFILDKPPLPGEVGSDDVYYVSPGDTDVPDNADQSTYYFLPGVHQLFVPPWGSANGGEMIDGRLNGSDDDFRLRSGKRYYIPGDAIVHGTFNNEDNLADGKNIRIYGHGTISGERIPHHQVLGIINPGDTYHLNKPVRVNKAKGARVEGITIADSANHSLALKNAFEANPQDYSYVRWVKIITWRANGDGVSPNGSGYLEDSFIRTQDDGTYISGLGIRRNTYWSDVNGMALRASNILNDNNAIYRVLGDLVVEDIDVLYARGVFGRGETGHSIIGYPSPPSGYSENNGSHILFKNVFVHDRFPTRRLFGLDTYTEEYDLDTVPPEVTGTEREQRLPIAGLRFENVRAAAPPFVDFPAPAADKPTADFLGWTTATITGLNFKNVTLAGEHYNEISDFSTNNNFTPDPPNSVPPAINDLPAVGIVVSGFVFENVDPQTISFNNDSGYAKWYVGEDWSSGTVPANNDDVVHSKPLELIVDDHAYAGTITVSSAGGAAILIAADGRLTVTKQINLGSPSGRGEIRVSEGGELIVENDLGSALTIDNGSISLDGGSLRWRGDRIDELRTLFSSGVIALLSVVDEEPPAGAELIGRQGSRELFASSESGFTKVYVATGALPQQEAFNVPMPWLATAVIAVMLTFLASGLYRRSGYRKTGTRIALAKCLR